ncbi:hypothetical protein KIH27_02130 [Mycobacterium sp. M1]|uniref:Uncharacterized protein n=1 Tax=Mycolicibacter acidiphilus TaxID=2835306 RepID=A0ABS5RDM2_9MYCO|nr:hypothetical protein [Mycolicibacter acidiphilus]MBS9532383.1 hypothetical protein [Mycolicibacter acidiphilus]
MSETPETVEATYAGVEFRSTSERTFAEALDRAGLLWSYEPGPQTVVARDGVQHVYWPDFWLLTVGCWLEVKGPANRRLWKAESLNAAGPHQVLLGRAANFGAHGTASLLIETLAPEQPLPAVFTSSAWQNASTSVLWPRPPIRGLIA